METYYVVRYDEHQQHEWECHYNGKTWKYTAEGPQFRYFDTKADALEFAKGQPDAVIFKETRHNYELQSERR